jgi:hypothetical protein
MDNQDRGEIKDPEDFKVYKDYQELKDNQDKGEIKDPEDFKAIQDPEEIKDLQGSQDNQEGHLRHNLRNLREDPILSVVHKFFLLDHPCHRLHWLM